MTRLMVNRVGQFLRLYRRLVIALALLLTIYAAVGFWVVPYVARRGIEKYVVEDLHRRRTPFGLVDGSPADFPNDLSVAAVVKHSSFEPDPYAARSRHAGSGRSCSPAFRPLPATYAAQRRSASCLSCAAEVPAV